MYEVYPITRPAGKPEAAAVKDEVLTLNARIKNWLLEPAGIKKWGESSHANFSAYVDWLFKNGVLKVRPEVSDLVTNEFIDEINQFDRAGIESLARSYKAE